MKRQEFRKNCALVNSNQPSSQSLVCPSVSETVCDAFEHLVCPVDGSKLIHERGWLVSGSGRRYPIANGVAVMLRDDVSQTLGVAGQSLEWARRWANGDRADPYFVETLGISQKQRDDVRTMIADERHSGFDPVASFLIAATNGILYKDLIGQLDQIPIPELRMDPADEVDLLDVGCSWGRWSIAAAVKGFRPTGVDPSLGAVLAAKRLAHQQGLGFHAVVADARHLPFQQGAFRAAFSYSVLQHFSKPDAERAFQEIARVLAPGATARIQMASAIGVRSFQSIVRRGFRTPRDFEVRYWSPWRLKEVFEKTFAGVQLEVDCYFGLGLQPTDWALYGPLGRTILAISEALRRTSEVFGPLRYVADSVYLVGTKSAGQRLTHDHSGT